MLSQRSPRSCKACLQALRPVPVQRPASSLRSFASTSHLLSTPPSTPPPPFSSSSSPPRSPHASSLEAARTQAQRQLTSVLSTLNLSARARARAFSSALAALELERKLGQAGAKINKATGYEEIERLRKGVAEREKALLEVREHAGLSKKAYTAAVALRGGSQREVNDLLQRKSSWSSADVTRFTELVQQDHENERAEQRAKEAMDAGEEGVEKGFSDLMQAILERYHEEQVWSDKIRSLSTYGSLAITSLNVLLFIITILLVEPWKRKRLVEGVEARLRANTNQGHEATLASLTTLQSLLADAQTKLDLLVPPPPPPPTEILPAALDESSQVQGIEDPALYPFTEDRSLESEVEPELPEVLLPVAPPVDLVAARKEREKELWMVGAGGAVAGVGISLMLGLLSPSR